MSKEEIKLIALDLDGTALTSEKTMTQRMRDAIAKAGMRGIEVVAASGRSRNGIMQIIADLPGMHYMIASNGASALDLVNDKLVYGAYIKPERALGILEKLLTIGVMGDIYYDGGALSDYSNYKYIAQEKNGFPEWFIKYFISNRRPVENLLGMLRDGKIPVVEKVTVSFDDMSLREKAYELMRDEKGLSIVAGSPFNMEISHENATKGKALAALAKALGIDMKHVMAIGDTGNDVSMIQAAGIGVAMGNADEQIRALADVHTASNDEDGAALAIERYAL